MKLYLEVTQDELSLPIIVETSPIFLAQITKLNVSNVNSQISRSKTTKYPRFIMVEVEDD